MPSTRPPATCAPSRPHPAPHECMQSCALQFPDLPCTPLIKTAKQAATAAYCNGLPQDNTLRCPAVALMPRNHNPLKIKGRSDQSDQSGKYFVFMSLTPQRGSIPQFHPEHPATAPKTGPPPPVAKCKESFARRFTPCELPRSHATRAHGLAFLVHDFMRWGVDGQCMRHGGSAERRRNQRIGGVAGAEFARAGESWDAGVGSDGVADPSARFWGECRGAVAEVASGKGDGVLWHPETVLRWAQSAGKTDQSGPAVGRCGGHGGLV